jgi:Na+(H+)/acetate symporter ActP
MTSVVVAVILISIIFLMGLALGVLATLLIGRQKDGPGPH